jgi:hypothetical protein
VPLYYKTRGSAFIINKNKELVLYHNNTVVNHISIFELDIRLLSVITLMI